jgi:hypothetical protein
MVDFSNCPNKSELVTSLCNKLTKALND